MKQAFQSKDSYAFSHLLGKWKFFSIVGSSVLAFLFYTTYTAIDPKLREENSKTQEKNTEIEGKALLNNKV